MMLVAAAKSEAAHVRTSFLPASCAALGATFQAMPAGAHCGYSDGWDYPMDVRRGVALVRQLSRGECTEGYTWGFDRRDLWVTQGCRAEFSVW